MKFNFSSTAHLHDVILFMSIFSFGFLVANGQLHRDRAPNTLPMIDQHSSSLQDRNNILTIDKSSRSLEDTLLLWNNKMKQDVYNIPIYIDTGFDNDARKIIRQNLKQLMFRSKVIKFLFLASKPKGLMPYLLYTGNDEGCSSWVGRIEEANRGQVVSLSEPGCLNSRLIQHETLHSMGFYHEMSRPDRDDYIHILWENIKDGKERNFEIVEEMDSLGVDYDYKSVLHYSDHAYSRNGDYTMVSRRDQDIVRSNEASEDDILKLRLLYQCDQTVGPRNLTEYESQPCTINCKCWEGKKGCGSSDSFCKGDLVCRNDTCVETNDGFKNKTITNITNAESYINEVDEERNNEGGESDNKAQSTSVKDFITVKNRLPSNNGKIKIPFGRAITVGFNISSHSNESERYYIAILKGWTIAEDGPEHISLLSRVCAEVDRGTCDRANGEVTFSVKDTISELEDTFPLHSGKYRACIMDSSRDTHAHLACKRFKIKKMPRKHIEIAAVNPTKTSYEYGDPIDANFSTIKMSTVRQWIGIYPLSQVESHLAGEEKELPRERIWIYTGCNNQTGDTINGCSIKNRKGSVSFNQHTLDTTHPSSSWPLQQGQYALCMIFTYDRPYNYWKCSESTFQIN